MLNADCFLQRDAQWESYLFAKIKGAKEWSTRSCPEDRKTKKAWAIRPYFGLAKHTVKGSRAAEAAAFQTIFYS